MSINANNAGLDEVYRRQAKNRRLLERMAPELEAIKKKLESSAWSKTDRFPRGGIVHMGLPKESRRHDTRRRLEEARIRGWRTTKVESNSVIREKRVRVMIGNRNGSEKTLEDRRIKAPKQLPRTLRRHIELRESFMDLAAMQELEAERRAEEEMRSAEEANAEGWQMDSCAIPPRPAEKPREAGYYPYFY